MATTGALPVQAITAGAGLVTDPELAMLCGERLDQAPHGPVTKLPLGPAGDKEDERRCEAALYNLAG